MTVKRFTSSFALLAVSGLLSTVAVASAAIAPSLNEAAQVTANEVAVLEENNDEPVRQGFPGRRLGGGTRGNGPFLHEAESLANLTVSELLTIDV